MSAPPERPERRHLLTVAVEDYFQVSAFGELITPRQWGRFESRVERNTQRTLELLDEFGIRATFFTLGWVAERMPGVVEEIAKRGHEVASKGYYHRTIQDMTPAEFRDDLVRTREAIERATRKKVLGHRVAQGTFHLTDLWALDVLAEEGFAYDSSIYPRFRSISAEPWRRFPHVHEHAGKTIWEFPLSTWGSDEFLLPVAGGNYFRQFPHAVMERAVRHWHDHFDAPFNMYFHVWELDPDLPQISAAGPITRIRQYRNLGKMRWVLSRYFEEYRFGSIADHLGLEGEAVEWPAPPASNGVAPTIVPSTEDTGTPVTVVVPCFNEERVLPFLANTLAEVLLALSKEYSLTFLFVDDGSSDGTWDALHRVFGAWPNCRFIRHERNRGVAAAILTGIHAAESEIVCSIDCDCTYDPHQLEKMIPKLEDGVDMVTASPYHEEGAVRNVPTWRLTLSKGLSMLYRGILNHRFATYTSCFRVYRRTSMMDVEIAHDGFLGVAEMLGRLDLRGANIVECPAVLEVRMLGRSKMQTARTIAGHLKLLSELSLARVLSDGGGGSPKGP